MLVPDKFFKVGHITWLLIVLLQCHYLTAAEQPNNFKTPTNQKLIFHLITGYAIPHF